MKLIDESEVLKLIDKEYEVCNSGIASGILRLLMARISALPTIEAKPVVHGEWEDLREAYNDVPKSRCSLCGREIIGLESNYNFCPNCGAEMRERKET